VTTPSFELTNISQRFADVQVLHSVSLSLQAGKICALVGENGAGKSTLVNIACGLVRPTEGGVWVQAREVTGWTAAEAVRNGVGVVHQHWVLVDTLTVAENVVLGREPRRGPFGIFFDRARAERNVAALAKKYGFTVDSQAIVAELSVGERQRVELLRVLDTGAKVLLFDEPTAVLSPLEIESLLSLLRSLAASGAAILLISHKLAEVFAVADDIVVLRRGKVVLHAGTSTLTPDQVAQAMVGGELDVISRTTDISYDKLAPPALMLREAVTDKIRGITLSILPGEILGIAGVEGNGQAELFSAIAGLERLRSGVVMLGDKDVSAWSVADRRRAGLGFVPEDRQGAGLCGELSIAENLALGVTAALSGEAIERTQSQERLARDAIEKFDIRPPNPSQIVHTLSGGNAQKVLIARELGRPDMSVLLLAQPTRGVDLGAAITIRQQILSSKSRAVATLLVSSSLDELRELSDRIVVMRDGALVAEFAAQEATDEALGPWMVGAKQP
jgi:simple sugar transport system ATP-binding protein